MPNSEPRRRRSDRGWRAVLVRENWYRDVWLLIITAVVLVAIAIGTHAASEAERLTVQQARGRAVAIQALCVSTSAVIDAGRQTITAASGKLPTKFERALERLGYPPRKVQRAQAQAAARAYGAVIAARVEQSTHVKGIARPDGSLDCARLRRAAHAVSLSGR